MKFLMRLMFFIFISKLCWSNVEYNNARASGMVGGTVALSDEVSSMLVNPASVIAGNKSGFGFVYNKITPEVSGFNLFYSHRFTGLSLGVGYSYLGASETVEAYSKNYYLNSGIKFSENFFIGANLKLLNEYYGINKKEKFDTSIGTVLKFSENFKFGLNIDKLFSDYNIISGIAISLFSKSKVIKKETDLDEPSIDINFESDSDFNIDDDLDISKGYNFDRNEFKAPKTFNKERVFNIECDLSWNMERINYLTIGIEWWLFKGFALRSGILYGVYYKNFSFGLGISFSIKESLRIDFAYRYNNIFNNYLIGTSYFY